MIKHRLKIFFTTLVLSILSPCGYFTLFAQSANNTTIVYCLKTKDTINRKIFGNNLLSYNPKTYEQNRVADYWGHEDYGTGAWDGKWAKPIDEAVALLKETGTTVLRYPGGAGSKNYDWKETIGKNRKHFLFGLDEFLVLCKEVGAEPIITLSYFTGTPQDAADMVEYLNLPDDGKHPWAAKRAANGRKEPYNVKYFEVGNETYCGNQHTTYTLLPQDYAKQYLVFYDALKTADPAIQLGVVLYTDAWNKQVANIIGAKVDFSIIHTYPNSGSTNNLEGIPADEIFELSLASPVVKDDYVFKETVDLFKRTAGKIVPIAVTEFNGGYTQEKPVQYRFALGCALVNAELIRVMMKPENNILMANHWQFFNSYWGMVTNGFHGDYKDLRKPYCKRPNYYVFELYAKHFGDTLLQADTESGTYDINKYNLVKSLIGRLTTGTLVKKNILPDHWNILPINDVTVTESQDILEITFPNPTKVNYYHCVKTAAVEPGCYYKVSGYIKADNLIGRHGVCLEVQDAHSRKSGNTAISTPEVSHTQDWKYVEALYQASLDTNEVKVIVREVGGKEYLSGKAFLKDVRLEKFIPTLDTKIPYLSVNASESKDGKKVYLMVINKNLENSETTTINLKDFTPSGEGQAWVLNGPAVDSTNEQNHDNVKVTPRKFKVDSNSFEYTFEPHSLTAIEVDTNQ